MTLDGTNSWVLTEPGATRSVVIDPGPVEDGHVDELDEQTGDVALVLLTHHHYDHSEVAVDLATRKGCPVRALDPAYCHGADPLADDEVIDVDGLRLRVVTTPGHTADSVSFVLPAERALLSGDMVLGRGTTVVAHPDGQLGPYFDSIERMRALAAPGRRGGPDLARPRPGPRRRARHPGALPRAPAPAAGPGPRRPRAGWASTGRTPTTRSCRAASSRSSTQDVDEALWGAAEWSVRAQLAYLAEN